MAGRRRTRLGTGAFGNPRDPGEHGREVLRRILGQRLPLTEDAVFLCLWHQLTTRRGSQVFRNVRTSKGIPGYGYYSFSPDVDLLEDQTDGFSTIVFVQLYERHLITLDPLQYPFVEVTIKDIDL